MSYQVNFGHLAVAAARPVVNRRGPFRIAVLGDFSARANTGHLETGAALAARKPLKVDCDNLEAILKRLNIKLKLPLGTGAVELSIGSMDDFHPDQLYGALGIFSELAGLRQRLRTPSLFAKAAKEAQAWVGKPAERKPAPRRSRGAELAVDAKLSDFARLVGKPSVPTKTAVPIADLLKQIVGPYIVPAKDPRADSLIAAVDQALSETMRAVLHHPDFQSVESLWRSLDLLTRRLETDANLQLVLVDMTAEELAADVSQADALENSGLYKLLVEQPALDAHQGPFAVIIGNYTFERTPPHAELLGRIAKIVAQAPAPFIASISADVLDENPKDLHPLIKDAWDALAAMPEASCLGLATPRFMLRHPYGKKTDPIEAFAFEEFTPRTGLRGLLWGNPAILAGLLLGQSYAQQGAQMKLGSIMTVDELPFYFFTDQDNDQIPLPCTERLLTTRLAAQLTGQGFMPLAAIKGSPEVRLASFGSLTGALLAGSWKPPAPSVADAPGPTPAPSEEAAPAEETPPADAEAAPEPAEAESPASAEPPAESAPAESAPADKELDTLLADLGKEDAPAAASAPEAASGAGEEMDPDLAKLLKELGS